MSGCRRIVSGVLAGMAVAALAPTAASAATLAQVRARLLSWHLTPSPLFPTRLPAVFKRASVALSRDSSVPLDYDIEWSRNARNVNVFTVALKRGPAALLQEVLNDPEKTSERQITIGTRHVYALETGHAGAPFELAWQEGGSTYLVQEKYVDRKQGMRTLGPLVRALRPL
jgi:hypothetical protein